MGHRPATVRGNRAVAAPDANSVEAVAERAKAVGNHRTTLYRWMNTYLKSGSLTALLPDQPGAATGQKRLAADMEEIISTIIEEPHAAEDHPGTDRDKGSQIG